MTDELIIESVNEAVIIVDGGPTLTTTVGEVTGTFVQEYADPIIIDLNAGPRGEPGAAIITGPHPPSGVVGVMGDMYIVTEGTVLVGQVFKKTGPSSWTDVGNVRGPAGGVNTVNGQTGPDVILTKADVGLGNVTDSAQVDLTTNQSVDGVKTFVQAPIVPDASFAIVKVSGLQSALDLKATDTTVVHLAGAETITGIKTFSVAPVVPDNSFAIAKVDGLATALGGKEATITAGTTAQYWRGDKSWQTLNKSAVGLANVDNTSDANKPVSTAQQTALNAKENTIAAGTTAQYWRGDKSWQTLNPTAVGLGNVANTAQVDLVNAQTIGGVKTFSASPIVPTPTTATQVANKGYVDTTISAIVDAAPGTLDTLNELAAALGDDPNFATTITNNLATKVNLTGNQQIDGRIVFHNSTNVSASQSASIEVRTSHASGKPTIYFHNPSIIDGILNLTQSGVFEFRNNSDTGYMPMSAGAVSDSGNRVYSASNAPAISAVTGLQTALNAKEGTIAAGTTAQYYRGDKTWQNLNSATVDLTTAQTIGGAKTFSALITASAGVTVTGTVTATTFSGSGASLTQLPAGNLTGTVAQARLVQNIVRVVHGSTASTARPTGATYVEWIGSVSPTNIGTNDTWINTSTNGNTADLSPTGVVVATAQAASAAPSGWYWCEGQQVLISGDTALYNALTNNGTVFPYGANTNGSGAAGSTHFRLPDMRGKVIVHVDGTTEFTTLGKIYGTKGEVLTTAQIPAHTHPITDPTHRHTGSTGTGITYGVNRVMNAAGGGVAGNHAVGYAGGIVTDLADGSASAWSAHIHQFGTSYDATGITVNANTGGGGSHNNVQPSMMMRYMVKR